ncbi:unnamed protein product [Caenorhabditis auriculariae]|uniref:Tyrosinase copper-binding domain-containing protein n=1 Tax=Caenorhabditis auriculariae TaxID=2777116 RepID=A0A8S1HC60_9PELO|nr:unnamed protein product [Caenorhabditis auriculariae]
MTSLQHLEFSQFILAFFLPFCSSFLTVTEYRVGNRTYVEKFYQPWFRKMHYDHDRIEESEKATSAFGKHFVPEDDVFVKPDWTPRDAKYLACMNRQCVCPYFDGKIIDGECRLPSGKILKKAHRQELRSLSDEHRKQIEGAWNVMKSSGVYNRLGRVHKYSGVHSGPAFVLWHREFLKRLELVLRTLLPDPDFGIPYWDSTLDAMLPSPKDSIIFSELFLGEVDEEGLVKNGPYHNWETMEGRAQIKRKFDDDVSGEMLNNARVDWLVNNHDYNMILGASMPLSTCPMNHTLDARMLEYSHDYVHFFVSGDMSRSFSSSNDIVFVYHHSMVDWIFERYRQNMQDRKQRETEYPPSDDRCFPNWHNFDNDMPLLQPMKNRDALSNAYTDNLYEFAERPTCSREHRNCDSKYLFCFVPEDVEEPPYCMSKVKIGGNCTGFSEYPICFQGKCIEDRCVKLDSLEEPVWAKLRKFVIPLNM